MSGTTGILLDAISYERNTQADVAQTYAWAIQRGDADWRVVNEAIIERWSKSGLSRIKRMAWEREQR
jgi:hypothetical protein